VKDILWKWTIPKKGKKANHLTDINTLIAAEMRFLSSREGKLKQIE
jgi:hypothetical protein